MQSTRTTNFKRFQLTGYFILLLLTTKPVIAGEAESLFHEANRLYQAGEYAEAATAYEQILTLGKENWQTYFNLGNSCFKQGQIGKAILNYERALRLDRKNEDIQFNLDLVNVSVKDRILDPPLSLTVIWLDNIMHFFPVEISALISLIAWIIMFIGLILMIVGQRAGLRRIGKHLTLSAGTVWIIFALSFGFLFYEIKAVRYGILMESRIAVRSSPAIDAIEVFVLHEGAKMKLEDHSGDWIRIRLKDGKVGWLLQNSVEMI